MATKTRICPECGTEFTPPPARGQQRVFCCDAHKTAHKTRMTVRGQQLAKVALGWRITRGSGDFGKWLFSEMTSLLDQWNSEDKAAGRMKADDYMKLVANFTPVNPDYYNGKTFEADRWFDRQDRKGKR